jgi:hypothetical protein
MTNAIRRHVRNVISKLIERNRKDSPMTKTLNIGEEQGPHIIVYKANGADLNLTTRYIGPFATFGDAYEALSTLEPPINGGHKFIQALEQPTIDDRTGELSVRSRSVSDAEAAARRFEANPFDVVRHAVDTVRRNLKDGLQRVDEADAVNRAMMGRVMQCHSWDQLAELQRGAAPDSEDRSCALEWASYVISASADNLDQYMAARARLHVLLDDHMDTNLANSIPTED